MDVTCPRCGASVTADRLDRDFAGMCPNCLADFAMADGEPLPKIKNLEILGRIGRGGMGAVYRARQTHLGRHVALKVLDRTLTEEPGFVERFHREARAMAQLNHPNIVTIHDFGEEGGVYYLLIEYVDGTNLRSILKQKLLTADQALAIIPQLCDALQYAHAQGIVHRDLKPENVLVGKDGRVKIADYGIAKITGAEGTSPGLTGSLDVMGTLHYMAPEQYENPKTVDHRADIYSLGVMFYEMLTGELPLGRFAAPSKKAGVDARLDEVVFKTLEKDPAHRYQQASEVREDVTRIGGRAIEPAPPPSAAPTAQILKARFKSPATLILLAIFAMSVALLVGLSQFDAPESMILAPFTLTFLSGGAAYLLVAIPATMDLFRICGRSRWAGLAAAILTAGLLLVTAVALSVLHGRRETGFVIVGWATFAVGVAGYLLTGPRQRPSPASRLKMSVAELFILGGAVIALTAFLTPWGYVAESEATAYGFDDTSGWILLAIAALIGAGAFISRPPHAVHPITVGQVVLALVGLLYAAAILGGDVSGAMIGLYGEGVAGVVMLTGSLMRLRQPAKG